MLPQAAWRLDASPEIGPDEVRVRVRRLNLDAASFQQLHDKHSGDGARVRAEVAGDHRQPRQDAEPGDRVGRDADRGRRGGRPGVAPGPGGGGPDRHPRLADAHAAADHRRPRVLGRDVGAGALRRDRDPLPSLHRGDAPGRHARGAGDVGQRRLRRAGPHRAGRPRLPGAGDHPDGGGARGCGQERLPEPGRGARGGGRAHRGHRARRAGGPGPARRRDRRRRGAGRRPGPGRRGRRRRRGARAPGRTSRSCA